MTLKRPPYDLRRRRDREAALLGAHLARGARVWWLAHEVWRQLAEPRAYRAGRMARHAAVAGTEPKADIARTLRFKGREAPWTSASAGGLGAPLHHARGGS